MMLPYRIVVWVGCFCFFALENASIAFAMDRTEPDTDQAHQRRTPPPPVIADNEAREDEGFVIVPIQKSDGQEVSLIPKKPLRQFHLVDPTPEKGPAPAFMRPETYADTPPENSFNFKKCAMVSGGILLAASPFVWGPYAFAVMSSYYFGGLIGVTELAAGITLKSGLTSTAPSATDSNSENTKDLDSTTGDTPSDLTAEVGPSSPMEASSPAGEGKAKTE